MKNQIRTAITDEEELDEVIVIGSTPSRWSSHRIYQLGKLSGSKSEITLVSSKSEKPRSRRKCVPDQNDAGKRTVVPVMSRERGEINGFGARLKYADYPEISKSINIILLQENTLSHISIFLQVNGYEH